MVSSYVHADAQMYKLLIATSQIFEVYVVKIRMGERFIFQIEI